MILTIALPITIASAFFDNNSAVFASFIPNPTANGISTEFFMSSNFSNVLFIFKDEAPVTPFSET